MKIFSTLSHFYYAQICTEKKTILSVEDIIALIGEKCDGVIGQVIIDDLNCMMMMMIMIN